ncbi:MAG: class I SAM-dependent methyltransferase [Candidatus Omnitrophica bacterium]|nr:class I SAM-dependent methyltransferase [Candidatus Omnitrophota bacterium]
MGRTKLKGQPFQLEFQGEKLTGIYLAKNLSYFELQQLRDQLKDYFRRTIENYRTIFNQDPQNVPARVELIRIYRTVQSYRGVFSMLERTLQADPGNRGAWREVADTLVFLGRTQFAVEKIKGTILGELPGSVRHLPESQQEVKSIFKEIAQAIPEYARAEVREINQIPTLASRRDTLWAKLGNAILIASSTLVRRTSTAESLSSTADKRPGIGTTISKIVRNSLLRLSMSVPTSVTVYLSLKSLLGFINNLLSLMMGTGGDRRLFWEPVFVKIKIPARAEVRSGEAGSQQITTPEISPTIQRIQTWVQTHQGSFLEKIYELIGNDPSWSLIGTDRGLEVIGKKQGWKMCRPASIALSRILSEQTGLPIGQHLSGNHIELKVDIYDPGIPEEVEENTYIKIFIDGKIIYLDPVYNLLRDRSKRMIELRVFDNDTAAIEHLKREYHLKPFDPNHSGIAQFGAFKGLKPEDIQKYHGALEEQINAADWGSPSRIQITGPDGTVSEMRVVGEYIGSTLKVIEHFSPGRLDGEENELRAAKDPREEAENAFWKSLKERYGRYDEGERRKIGENILRVLRNVSLEDFSDLMKTLDAVLHQIDIKYRFIFYKVADWKTDFSRERPDRNIAFYEIAMQMSSDNSGSYVYNPGQRNKFKAAIEAYFNALEREVRPTLLDRLGTFFKMRRPELREKVDLETVRELAEQYGLENEDLQWWADREMSEKAIGQALATRAAFKIAAERSDGSRAEMRIEPGAAVAAIRDFLQYFDSIRSKLEQIPNGTSRENEIDDYYQMLTDLDKKVRSMRNAIPQDVFIRVIEDIFPNQILAIQMFLKLKDFELARNALANLFKARVDLEDILNRSDNEQMFMEYLLLARKSSEGFDLSRLPPRAESVRLRSGLGSEQLKDAERAEMRQSHAQVLKGKLSQAEVEYLHEFNQMHGMEEEGLLSAIQKKIDTNEGEVRILDLGSGPEVALLRIIQKIFGDQVELTTVDKLPYRNRSPGIDYLQGNALEILKNLALQHRQFDIILSHRAFHHFKDSEKSLLPALRSTRDLIAPGGWASIHIHEFSTNVPQSFDSIKSNLGGGDILVDHVIGSHEVEPVQDSLEYEPGESTHPQIFPIDVVFMSRPELRAGGAAVLGQAIVTEAEPYWITFNGKKTEYRIKMVTSEEDFIETNRLVNQTYQAEHYLKPGDDLQGFPDQHNRLDETRIFVIKDDEGNMLYTLSVLVSDSVLGLRLGQQGENIAREYLDLKRRTAQFSALGVDRDLISKLIRERKISKEQAFSMLMQLYLTAYSYLKTLENPPRQIIAVVNPEDHAHDHFYIKMFGFVAVNGTYKLGENMPAVILKLNMGKRVERKFNRSRRAQHWLGNVIRMRAEMERKMESWTRLTPDNNALSNAAEEAFGAEGFIRGQIDVAKALELQPVRPELRAKPSSLEQVLIDIQIAISEADEAYLPRPGQSPDYRAAFIGYWQAMFLIETMEKKHGLETLLEQWAKTDGMGNTLWTIARLYIYALDSFFNLKEEVILEKESDTLDKGEIEDHKETVSIFLKDIPHYFDRASFYLEQLDLWLRHPQSKRVKEFNDVLADLSYYQRMVKTKLRERLDDVLREMAQAKAPYSFLEGMLTPELMRSNPRVRQLLEGPKPIGTKTQLKEYKRKQALFESRKSAVEMLFRGNRRSILAAGKRFVKLYREYSEDQNRLKALGESAEWFENAKKSVDIAIFLGWHFYLAARAKTRSELRAVDDSMASRLFIGGISVEKDGDQEQALMAGTEPVKILQDFSIPEIGNARATEMINRALHLVLTRSQEFQPPSSSVHFPKVMLEKLYKRNVGAQIARNTGKLVTLNRSGDGSFLLEFDSVLFEGDKQYEEEVVTLLSYQIASMIDRIFLADFLTDRNIKMPRIGEEILLLYRDIARLNLSPTDRDKIYALLQAKDHPYLSQIDPNLLSQIDPALTYNGLIHTGDFFNIGSTLRPVWFDRISDYIQSYSAVDLIYPRWFQKEAPISFEDFLAVMTWYESSLRYWLEDPAVIHDDETGIDFIFDTKIRPVEANRRQGFVALIIKNHSILSEGLESIYRQEMGSSQLQAIRALDPQADIEKVYVRSVGSGGYKKFYYVLIIPKASSRIAGPLEFGLPLYNDESELMTSAKSPYLRGERYWLERIAKHEPGLVAGVGSREDRIFPEQDEFKPTDPPRLLPTAIMEYAGADIEQLMLSRTISVEGKKRLLRFALSKMLRIHFRMGGFINIHDPKLANIASRNWKLKGFDFGERLGGLVGTQDLTAINPAYLLEYAFYFWHVPTDAYVMDLMDLSKRTSLPEVDWADVQKKWSAAQPQVEMRPAQVFDFIRSLGIPPDARLESLNRDRVVKIIDALLAYQGKLTGDYLVLIKTLAQMYPRYDLIEGKPIQLALDSELNYVSTLATIRQEAYDKSYLLDGVIDVFTRTKYEKELSLKEQDELEEQRRELGKQLVQVLAENRYTNFSPQTVAFIRSYLETVDSTFKPPTVPSTRPPIQEVNWEQINELWNFVDGSDQWREIFKEEQDMSSFAIVSGKRFVEGKTLGQLLSSPDQIQSLLEGIRDSFYTPAEPTLALIRKLHLIFQPDRDLPEAIRSREEYSQWIDSVISAVQASAKRSESRAEVRIGQEVRQRLERLRSQMHEPDFVANFIGQFGSFLAVREAGLKKESFKRISDLGLARQLLIDIDAIHDEAIDGVYGKAMSSEEESRFLEQFIDIGKGLRFAVTSKAFRDQIDEAKVSRSQTLLEEVRNLALTLSRRFGATDQYDNTVFDGIVESSELPEDLAKLPDLGEEKRPELRLANHMVQFARGLQSVELTVFAVELNVALKKGVTVEQLKLLAQNRLMDESGKIRGPVTEAIKEKLIALSREQRPLDQSDVMKAINDVMVEQGFGRLPVESLISSDTELQASVVRMTGILNQAIHSRKMSGEATAVALEETISASSADIAKRIYNAIVQINRSTVISYRLSEAQFNRIRPEQRRTVVQALAESAADAVHLNKFVIVTLKLPKQAVPFARIKLPQRSEVRAIESGSRELSFVNRTNPNYLQALGMRPVIVVVEEHSTESDYSLLSNDYLDGKPMDLNISEDSAAQLLTAALAYVALTEQAAKAIAVLDSGNLKVRSQEALLELVRLVGLMMGRVREEALAARAA